VGRHKRFGGKGRQRESLSAGLWLEARQEPAEERRKGKPLEGGKSRLSPVGVSSRTRRMHDLERVMNSSLDRVPKRDAEQGVKDHAEKSND